MEIEKIKLKDLKPSNYNPRKISDKELLKLEDSMEKFGYVEPIIFNKKTSNIVGGHQRFKVLSKKLKPDDNIDVVIVDLDEYQEKALNLALNRISGDWEDIKLADILKDIKDNSKELLKYTGFDENEILKILFNKNYNGSKLKDDFLFPPFSVFNARDGDWQKRKKEWKQIMGNTIEDRENALGYSMVMDMINSGTSLFDPVLSEILFLWFLPKDEKILNIFAGDVEPNFVAGFKGIKLDGIELRQEQVNVTEKILKEKNISCVNMICGDAKDIDNLVKDNEYGLIFSCPPYYNLEEYSDLEQDLSTKSIEEFDMIYKEVIKKSYNKLKDNRFSIFVVSETRDKDGSFTNLVKKTIDFHLDAGFKFYNEMILVTAVGTASLRARQYFEKNRKVARTHQNILVFYKGDINKIKDIKFMEIKNEEGITSTDK